MRRPPARRCTGRWGLPKTDWPSPRLRRTSDVGAAPPKHAASAASLRKLLDADCRSMGFDRGELIRHFAARAGSSVHEEDGAIALVRAGRKARQIGPVYAITDAAGVALLERTIAEEPGSLVIDLSMAHTVARKVLLSSGFVFERPFA